ncbi:heparinase II/III domain-containing protein [Microlunatus sp. Y2014]|uniref:heparinase II/III domain-containing protein n=1 Tax=Microlunatus sp. Y2014 TaxID=3418488 RepID=UPI003DA7861F
MKRRTFLVAASGAALAAGLAEWTTSARAVGAPGVGPTDRSPRVSTRTDLVAVADTVPGITLDGTLADERWGEPHWQDFTTLYDLTAVPATALHVVHDQTTLYVGVQVTGATAATVRQVSLLVQAGTGADNHWTSVKVRDFPTGIRFSSWGGETTELTGHRSAHRTADDRVTCEIAVPLAELGLTGDPAGREVAINVVIDHDDMTNPVTTVAPTRTSDNIFQSSSGSLTTDVVDEHRAATVHLGRIVPVADGRRAPTLVRDTDLRLDYVDYTHKRLTYAPPDGAVADTTTIDWREPGGAWTPLEATVKPTRGGVSATLEHPEPRTPGQYGLRIRTRARAGEDTVLVATFDRLDLITAGDQLPANQPHPPRGNTAITPAPASPEVAALLALIPDRTGFTFCGVPERPSLRPQNLFSWSADQPDKVIAKSTGTAYPNDQYPEDKELVVTNRLGEQVSYPYHEDAEGKRYFLSGHLWYQQREYVYDQLLPVAEADPLGAARLLHKFAQVFQGWVPTNEYPWLSRPVAPASTPRNHWWGGVWGRWSTSQLGPVGVLAQAFAIVEQTDALDVLSEEVGHDVRALITDDTFRPSVEWRRTFSPRYHNMDYPSYVGMAQIGKGLGDSSHTHEVVEWAGEYLRRGFLFDGFWKETTLSYHNQSVNGLFRVADSVKGWSDADGYSSPRTGDRFDDLDLLDDMPVLGSSSRIPNVLVYPDGKLLPIADTWASSSAGSPDFGAGSVIFGAGGVARLSRGRIPTTGPFGVVQQFPDLTITDQSVEVREFADSGTMQLEAAAADASVSFAFTAEAGNYDLDLLPFHAGTYGRYEISVDDAVVTEHDFFDTSSGVAEFFTLGRLDLTAGDHTITFRCLGKADASGGFKMGVVSLALLDEAARAERDDAQPPETANPSQANLLFTPKYGHNQWDPLSLAVYAEGQELFPDIGYTHTFYRRWTGSTLAHNTVVVDQDDMSSDGKDGGSVEVFDHVDEAVQVMRVEFGSAYPQTSRYLRETWSIKHPGTDREEGYLLDVFRVAGGSRHEFTLNGDANRDATWTTTAELTDHGPYLLPPGVEVTEPETENDYGSAEGHYYGYIYVRDVKKATLADGAYDASLATTVDEQPGSGAHVLGLAGDDTELFLGIAPSVRATRLNGTGSDTNDEAVKYWLPKLVLRREGTDLRSTFITAIEPHAAGAASRIAGIESVAHNGSEDDVAIKVTHADGTVDVIISSLDDAGSVTAEGVTVTGKLGFVRLVGGTATAAHLVGGSALTAPGKELTGTAPVAGTVTGTLSSLAGDDVDALVTSVEVPDWVVGHTIVVTHPDGKTHGYPIKAVSNTGGAGTVELDGIDPGFAIAADGSSAMVFTPFTTWTGETTFRIENGVSG